MVFRGYMAPSTVVPGVILMAVPSIHGIGPIEEVIAEFPFFVRVTEYGFGTDRYPQCLPYSAPHGRVEVAKSIVVARDIDDFYRDVQSGFLFEPNLKISE
jgi:hypothetical protein